MSDDLFDSDPPASAGAVAIAPDTPLADRMRPRSLDEVEGPAEVVGSNGFLRRALAEDRIPSLIFWGPPGVGKTTGWVIRPSGAMSLSSYWRWLSSLRTMIRSTPACGSQHLR